jgi:hypothetical protein
MANAMLEVTDNNIFLTQAAGKHRVSKQTLSDRFKERRTLADQIQSNIYLSKDQEAYLVLWILCQESLDYALSHQQICACIIAFLNQQNNTEELKLN